MDPTSLVPFIPIGNVLLGWWLKAKAEARIDLKEEREANRQTRKDDSDSADAAIKRIPFDVGSAMRWTLMIAALAYRYGGSLLAVFMGYPIVKENIIHVPGMFFDLIPPHDEIVYTTIWGFPLTYEDGVVLLSFVGLLLGAQMATSSRRI